jgi:hypothetical protein
MVSHQQAKGVRVKLFRRINPMSRFVDPEALLVLEAALDAGNDLALALDDQCWAMLMLLEHGAAADILRRAIALWETSRRAADGTCEGTVCGFVAGTCMRFIQDAMVYRAQTYASVFAMHMGRVAVYEPYVVGMPVALTPPEPVARVEECKKVTDAATGAVTRPGPDGVTRPGPDGVTRPGPDGVTRPSPGVTSDAGTRFPQRSISR